MYKTCELHAVDNHGIASLNGHHLCPNNLFDRKILALDNALQKIFCLSLMIMITTEH